MKKKYDFWDKLSLKCVLVGDTGVGKSSLAGRLTSRTFKTDYEPTLFDNFAGIHFFYHRDFLLLSKGNVM